MKSIKFVLIVFAALVTYNANAQVFVSGSIGFNSSSESFKVDGDKTDLGSESGFEFAPAAGYFLSDDFAIGLGLNFGSYSETIPATDRTDKTSTVGVTPFVRYYPLIIDRFSLFGMGGISISSTTSKTEIGNNTTENPSVSGFTFFVLPGAAFELNDNLSLETTINVLALTFHSQTEKDGDDKHNQSEFNFGAGLNNIVNTGNISIGAIYRF